MENKPNTCFALTTLHNTGNPMRSRGAEIKENLLYLLRDGHPRIVCHLKHVDVA